MNKMKSGQSDMSWPRKTRAGMGRRSWLAGSGAILMGAVLASCGHDDVGFRSGVNRDRVIVDDTGAGVERRLVVGQAIEIRLPIDAASGQTTVQKGGSSSRMRRDSGPERKAIDGRTYDVWVFVVEPIGDTAVTITLAYEQSGQALRELAYPVNVALS